MSDFRELIDLASERLGGSVLYATDDYFAGKENLVRQVKPVWKEHEYTDRGKWMDGWESRRKRTAGHDFAIVRLGTRGVIRGVVVDTAFFRGNYPAECSLEACSVREETSVDSLVEDVRWIEILPRAPLNGDSENLFSINASHAFTHLRLNIFPDGGVARLRVHGEVAPDWHREGGLANDQDLAAIEHGGYVQDCSDMFFGPKHNLIMPGRAVNMSDGWETRRRRGPGHDWVTLRLGCEAAIKRIEIDTSHFKGNFPDSCSIESKIDDGEWTELLPRTRLLADTRHLFVDELLPHDAATHLRLNVFPDGGVARLRVWARATDSGLGQALTQYVNTLTDEVARRELMRCCASVPWVDKMLATRPFPSWDALAVMADRIWWSLDQGDWLEAFAAHPRIGEKEGSRWSAQEQSGAADVDEEIQTTFIQANRDYEDIFGHIFIVCATGKSADEMLAIIQSRLFNEPVDELRVAAEEQRKITQLRLQKLVS